MVAKTEAEQISAGSRLESFLKDPEVLEAFNTLDARYVAKLREAKTPEEILGIHAKLQAVADFQRELRVVKDTGTVARREQEQRDQRAAAQLRQRPR